MQIRQDPCNDAQLCLDDMDWKEFRSLLKDQNARTSMAARQFAAPYFRERRASLSSLDEAELDQAHSDLQEEVHHSAVNNNKKKKQRRHSRSQSFTSLATAWSPFPRPASQNSRIKSTAQEPSKAPLKVTTATRRPRSVSMSHSSSVGNGSSHDSLASSSSSHHHCPHHDNNHRQNGHGGRAQRRFSSPANNHKQQENDDELTTKPLRVVERMRNKFHDSLTSLQMSFQNHLTMQEQEEEESSFGSLSATSANLSRQSVADGKLEVDFPEGGRRSYSGGLVVVESDDDDESDDAVLATIDDDLRQSSETISHSMPSSLPGSVSHSENVQSSLPRVPWDKFPTRKEALKKTDSARMLMDGLLVMAPDQEGSIRDLLELKRSGSSSTSGSFGCD